MFEWVTGNAQLQVVTLTEKSLTLNQNASSHFKDSQYVLVGFSKDGQVGIKSVTKRDLELNVYPVENLHKISIGKGYAKVNNKALCDLISAKVGKNLDGQKVIANYDKKERVLTFDLSSLNEEGVIL
ncbi:hypothetical protein [Erysipelothrix rhusiopathiae]|uniref:Uncharacterized protein n=1 Tax=Erysipelothrix rhusiopathiae ATCC 19414 TaxID=525280 RepID=E7FX58_ERYRH|nr:hypothetical protein [Erysipelothrix rhusiopathiae]EFY08706.1 hypothetical protein HMPREF0357_10813 [Erysipelothrix rhusiopathiae ATCC 19414]VEH83206.1 Uncharacterised protein [Erysipelothrix rhusiopathiae]